MQARFKPSPQTVSKRQSLRRICADERSSHARTSLARDPQTVSVARPTRAGWRGGACAQEVCGAVRRHMPRHRQGSQVQAVARGREMTDPVEVDWLGARCQAVQVSLNNCKPRGQK
jgi:hypothetical protein